MKNSLTIILLLLARCSFAQSSVPTQFDTFINRPTIQWAAYAFDSIRFSKPNLSAMLVNRVNRNQIKASLMLSKGSRESNHIKYAKKNEIKNRLYPICELPLYDSLGNLPQYYSEFKEPSSGVDSLSADLLFAPQILFVESGALKCYVPWVSPAYSIKTSSGVFIAFSWYFSAAFNFRYNYLSLVENKTIKLGKHKLRLKIDSIPKENMLKELYGKNLLWSLWPGIKSGSIKIYSVGSGEKILPKRLDNVVVSSAKCYDVYNDTGVIEQKCKNIYSIPFYITEVEIAQDWFYDYTANKVICKIPELFLYVGRDDDGNLCNSDTPDLKIVF